MQLPSPPAPVRGHGERAPLCLAHHQTNTDAHIDFWGRGAPLAAARIDPGADSGQQVAMAFTALGRFLPRRVTPAPVLSCLRNNTQRVMGAEIKTATATEHTDALLRVTINSETKKPLDIYTVDGNSVPRSYTET